MNDDDPKNWQEACLDCALEEHFGEEPPDDLSERILHRLAMQDAPVATRSAVRPRLAAAALFLVGLGTVCAVAVVASRPRPTQDPGARWCPLDPDATWTYAVRRGETQSAMTKRVMTATRFASPGEAERTVHQVFVEDGETRGFEHAALDAHGVYRFTGRLRGFSGIAPDTTATLLLPLPPAADARWTTTEQEARALGGQGFAGVMVGGRPERTGGAKLGEVVAIEVPAQVPAGKFTAVHVRLAPKDAQQPDQTIEQLWFAPGVGIVKRVLTRDGKDIEVAELSAFTPGKPDPEPEAALARFLARDAGVTSYGSVRSTAWLRSPASVLQLRARFAVVTFLDRKVAYCVRAGDVTAFDETACEAWSDLLRAEGFTGWSEGLLPQARTNAMADLACRLAAARRGLTNVADRRSSSFRNGPDEAACTWSIIGNDAEGRQQTVGVEFVILHNDKVSRVEFQE